MSELPSTDQYLAADDCYWHVDSATAGPLIRMSLEELANQAEMRHDGAVMMFSYLPTVPIGEPAQPRQYRVVKVERLP